MVNTFIRMVNLVIDRVEVQQFQASQEVMDMFQTAHERAKVQASIRASMEMGAQLAVVPTGTLSDMDKIIKEYSK